MLRETYHGLVGRLFFSFQPCDVTRTGFELMTEFVDLCRETPPFLEKFAEFFPRDIAAPIPEPCSYRIEIVS